MRLHYFQFMVSDCYRDLIEKNIRLILISDSHATTIASQQGAK